MMKDQFSTICGACRQGKHSQCHDHSCDCAKNNHELV